jgi:hypothetical protein
MDENQTLEEALKAAGDESQIAVLTDQAKKMTKKEISDFINGKDHDHVTMGTFNSIKALTLQRMKNGESIFPWKNMPSVKSDPDDLGAGLW